MSTEKVNAYLEITFRVKEENRAAAAAVFFKYLNPFLQTIAGAKTKQLLVRNEDVQVLHGFASEAEAEAYLKTDLFADDVVVELKPYFDSAPVISIYTVAG